MKVKDLADKVLECSLVHIARATRYGEDELRGYKTLLKKLKKHTGNAHIIGITGFPGAGKSTLIKYLIREYALEHNKKVGVVAVDPTSLSGGAILGDRTRMQIPELEPFDERVYIRSMAARGHSGGLAKNTAYVVDVLDAAGYEKIFVETVGAGQNDIDIMNLADTSLVVVNPGMGDIQALKGGIMEIADIYVINKSEAHKAIKTYKSKDSDKSKDSKDTKADPYSAEARKTEGEIRDMIRLSTDYDWEPKIYKTISMGKNPIGVTELIEGIEEHYSTLLKSVKKDKKIKEKK